MFLDLESAIILTEGESLGARIHNFIRERRANIVLPDGWNDI